MAQAVVAPSIAQAPLTPAVAGGARAAATPTPIPGTLGAAVNAAAKATATGQAAARRTTTGTPRASGSPTSPPTATATRRPARPPARGPHLSGPARGGVTPDGALDPRGFYRVDSLTPAPVKSRPTAEPDALATAEDGALLGDGGLGQEPLPMDDASP